MTKIRNITKLKNDLTYKNHPITKGKLLAFFIFTLIFISTSYLSVLFIKKHFSGETSFFSFELLSPIILLTLCILLIFYFILDALRSLYILKTLQIHINLGYLVKLSFINMFLSNITPFATGGGFAQIYFLNKKDISIGDATAVATIKATFPIIFFFITTPIILITNKDLLKIIPSGNNSIYIFSVIFMYVLVAYIFYKILKNTNVLKKYLSKVLALLERKKIISTDKAERFNNNNILQIDIFTLNIKRFSKGNKKYILLSMLFTILYLLILFMFPVILIKGTNANVSTSQIISMQILLTFITYFAPTPGATGFAEGGFTLMFSKYVGAKNILSLTFLWRFFTMYLGMLIGMVLFYLEIYKKRYYKRRQYK